MPLRYERVGTREVVDYWWVDFWEVVGPSGLRVVGYRYGPWKWYRGDDREYIWTGGEWEKIGEVRKRTDVPLQGVCTLTLGLCLLQRGYTHSHKAVNIAMRQCTWPWAMNTAMTYAHSHKAVTTYTAFLESDESPTSTVTLLTITTVTVILSKY
jgi:hypothetical protein